MPDPDPAARTMTAPHLSRRAFLAGGLGAGASVGLNVRGLTSGQDHPADESDALLDGVGRQLRQRFRDPRRHFVFEYYPWYANDPFRHWQQWDRVPPHDLAANTMPQLGAYDSRSTTVMEQHARWIGESGAGAINVSWWGREGFENKVVHQLMDVMCAHDIRVMFHLEPYRIDRADHFRSDVLYLLEEYGEKRRWDCLLFHEWADGTTGPIFKLFASLVPDHIIDCKGERIELRAHVPHNAWRRVMDDLRRTLREDFDRVTVLSDSPSAVGVEGAGWDGMALYGPTSRQRSWLDTALEASRKGLVFSFNANPGLDEIERRRVEFGSCYRPRPFIPHTRALDWSSAGDREHARQLSERQTRETLLTSVLLQTHPWLRNVDQGFFLVFLCSFNEWHEGHQFEPMRDAAALTSEERIHGYHNPDDGSYRLRCLTGHLRRLV